MGKNFLFVALSLVLTCGISSAQKAVSLDDEKPAESTQKEDPVTISGDRLAGAWNVDGQSVIVEANKSTIAINGTCKELTVNGSDNNIRSCKLESLTVTGGSNTVTYPDSCKPKISDKGKDNAIIARPRPHK